MNTTLRQCSMEKLHKLQLDRGQKGELEGLSRVYGLLLQVCGIKTQREVVTKICNKVSDV